MQRGISVRPCRTAAISAPSGVLLVLEAIQSQGWLDLTFGLLDGWWRFADRWRCDSALMPASQWQTVLADVGYDDIALSSMDKADIDQAGQAPYWRAPGRPRPRPELRAGISASVPLGQYHLSMDDR